MNKPKPPTMKAVANLAGVSIQTVSAVVNAKPGIPTVAIDRVPEAYHGAWAALDNARAGQMAAEHLLGLGHTCLVHIGGPGGLQLARERELGFRQAAAARGITTLASINAESLACESGFKVMQAILSGGRPTAVFAASDRMAIGAMLAVHEAGLKVPGDISMKQLKLEPALVVRGSTGRPPV
jgi:LacI family transcriptional regulator